MNTNRPSQPEVPESSGRKQRGPQPRDDVAAHLESMGLGLGSGRSYERCKKVNQRVEELRSRGYVKEGDILAKALDFSKRGAYDMSKWPDGQLLALCQVVIAGEARNLIEARWIVTKLIREEHSANEVPITLERGKNGMYRLRSLHNHASILLSAQDLLSLSELLLSLPPELQQEAEHILCRSSLTGDERTREE